MTGKLMFSFYYIFSFCMPDCFVNLTLFTRFTYLKQSDFKITFDFGESSVILLSTLKNVHNAND